MERIIQQVGQSFPDNFIFKKYRRLGQAAIILHYSVGARGFEPPTSQSRTARSTGLSHAPNSIHKFPIKNLSHSLAVFVRQKFYHTYLGAARRWFYFHYAFSKSRTFNANAANKRIVRIFL
jgi:hypothetical protein